MKPTTKADPINLVIVEDGKEVREGLRYLLNLDRQIRITETFSNAEQLLTSLKTIPIPDVVLMDIGLPRMNGIEATRILKEQYPGINVLILTIFEEEEKILDSIRAGANGYILKNTRPGELIEQIKSVYQGGSPISPTVARRILMEIQKDKRNNPKKDYNLTPREKQILKDIVDGCTYKEIAERYYIAGSTAKKHILHIYQKLNVTSKAEFVKKVIDEELI